MASETKMTRDWEHKRAILGAAYLRKVKGLAIIGAATVASVAIGAMGATAALVPILIWGALDAGDARAELQSWVSEGVGAARREWDRALEASHKIRTGAF